MRVRFPPTPPFLGKTMPRASEEQRLAAQIRRTDRVCTKCKGGQPLYRVKLKKGGTAKVNGFHMAINADAEVFECVRCRTQFLR